MSNLNKTEINNRYAEAVIPSIYTAGTNMITSNAHYDNSTTNDSYTLTGTRAYSKSINYSPQNIAVEMKMEMVIAMNAMMKIKDVEIIIPNKVVKVTFNDNTFEKAVCHEDDVFSLETAITICMTKHLLGGSGKFNNILAKGVKIVEDKVKAAEEAEKEKARIEAKRLKNHNKRVERRKRKEADARKARIQEMAEAIVLANEIMKTEANNKED